MTNAKELTREKYLNPNWQTMETSGGHLGSFKTSVKVKERQMDKHIKGIGVT